MSVCVYSNHGTNLPTILRILPITVGPFNCGIRFPALARPFEPMVMRSSNEEARTPWFLYGSPH